MGWTGNFILKRWKITDYFFVYLQCSISNPLKKGASVHFWQGFDLWRLRRTGHSCLVLFYLLLDLKATNYQISGSWFDRWWRRVCIDSAESRLLGIPVIQKCLLPSSNTLHLKFWICSCLLPLPTIQHDSSSAWLLWWLLFKTTVLIGP